MSEMIVGLAFALMALGGLACSVLALLYGPIWWMAVAGILGLDVGLAFLLLRLEDEKRRKN